jgi:hypothetical protein
MIGQQANIKVNPAIKLASCFLRINRITHSGGPLVVLQPQKARQSPGRISSTSSLASSATGYPASPSTSVNTIRNSSDIRFFIRFMSLHEIEMRLPVLRWSRYQFFLNATQASSNCTRR